MPSRFIDLNVADGDLVQAKDMLDAELSRYLRSPLDC
jgi:hypothetical protein